ncbi:hypothetical protein BD626DRAFT_484134 [Schizophyllum amplum]|uniref:Yeast cell wall synthesis Kre9/Knh1-like N-terminal domain-containing protein n=1 Tax=Schizophyllum amplum TaxID=97359 RepID=A0A550CQ49_9AGAR|nr:hypothetical protein BD626DRAFT_484134 [Auriculariopsis ampla]
MVSSSLLFLSMVSAALANVYTTSPIASTTFTGGQPATISWQDDGESPSLKDFGPAKVSIYVGNAMQQTMLQEITPSTDVSTLGSIEFTPDASIGPDSGEYFIRFESLSLKDATSPQYPALAFSAKFAMSGMSGAFSSDAQKQIDGQSTAPIASQTGSSSATKAASATTTKTSSTASKSATGTAQNAAAATESNAAISSGRVGGAMVATAFGFIAAALFA